MGIVLALRENISKFSPSEQASQGQSPMLPVWEDTELNKFRKKFSGLTRRRDWPFAHQHGGMRLGLQDQGLQ